MWLFCFHLPFRNKYLLSTYYEPCTMIGDGEKNLLTNDTFFMLSVYEICPLNLVCELYTNNLIAGQPFTSPFLSENCPRTDIFLVHLFLKCIHQPSVSRKEERRG